VLSEINTNYGNYRYGNYVGSAPRRKGNYFKDIKTENAQLPALSIVKMTGNDQLCAYIAVSIMCGSYRRLGGG